jgi:predicted nucleic acid-binding protein
MPAERVYWDAVCFIGRLQPHPDRIAALRHWTDRAERGEVEIVTSAWTLCEVSKVDEKLVDEEQEKKIADFFENPYILLRQIDRDVAIETRRIVRAYRLKPKDALHVATAVLTNCSVLHTYDDQHLTKLTLRVGNPPLRIEHPPTPNQLPLEGLESKPKPGRDYSGLVEDE